MQVVSIKHKVILLRSVYLIHDNSRDIGIEIKACSNLYKIQAKHYKND